MTSDPAAVTGPAPGPRRRLADLLPGRRSAGRTLIAFSALVVVAFCAVVLLDLWQRQRDTLTQMARMSENLTRVLEQHTIRTLQTVDLVLAATAEALRGVGDRPLDDPVVRALLRQKAVGTPIIHDLIVADPSGRIVQTAAQPDVSGPSPCAGLDASDPATTLRSSAPRLAAASTTITVCRPLYDLMGQPIGTLAAVLLPRYFQQFYETLNVGRHGNITLWNASADLVLIRQPLAPDLQDRRFAVGPLFERVAAGDRAGTFRSVSPLDSIDRVVSFRAVDGRPLVVSVGLASADELAGWRGDIRLGLFASVGIIGAVVMLTAVILRQVRREATTMAAIRLRDKAFETSSNGIVITDAGSPDLPAIYVNPAFERVTGYGAADVLGHNLRLLQGPFTSQPALDDLRSAIAAQQDYVGLLKNQRKDGSVLWNQLHLSAIRDDAGQITHYVGFLNDLTELKTATEDLLVAKREAEAANLAKTQFLSVMSHELRTPLNAIIGFSEVIRDRRLGNRSLERYLEYASDIHESGRHLLDLINEILDMAKLESRRMELYDEPIEVAALIESCAKLVRQRARDGSVVLVVNLPAALPELVADITRVKQIVINLLSNAVKFTRPGGRVSIAAELERDGSLAITIQDTGIGMTPAEIEIAFQPFRQVENGFARRHEGTGLGLPLAKALLDLHGGVLRLASAPGHGTTVSAIFPPARLRTPWAIRSSSLAV